MRPSVMLWEYFWVALVLLPMLFLTGPLVGGWLFSAKTAAELGQRLLRPMDTRPQLPARRRGAWRVPLEWALVGAAEEVFFRWLPSLASRGWLMGLAAASLFAAAHTVRPGRWLPRGLPVPQLLMGLWFWLGLVRFGVGAAIAAHAAYNLLLGGLVIGLRAAQRRQRRLRRRLVRYPQRPRFRALRFQGPIGPVGRLAWP